MMHLGIFIFGCISLVVTVAHQLDIVHKWQYIDYIWPSKAKKQEAIRKGTYNISSPIPTDVGVSEDGRVFVALIGKNTPARLAVITNRMGPSGPLLAPYPSWDWTDPNDCDAIILPYRIEIDRCNRLWVIDSVTSNWRVPRQCHPKLLAFDLKTDTLVEKVVIPEDIAVNAKTNRSLFTHVRVETHGKFCEQTTVYMSESLGNALVIWDGAQLSRIEHPTFNSRPEASNITVGNYSEKMPIGILGIDLSPKIFPHESQYLYYRPLSSYGLFAARTDHLKNGMKGQPIEISGADDILSSQSVGHSFSSKGTLFMSSTKEMSIICWNRYRQLNKSNIVTIAQDYERLQYANSIKIIPESIFGQEELWVLTDRLVRYDLKTSWNIKETNFRIFRSPVKRLIAGTKCELPREAILRLEAIASRG